MFYHEPKAERPFVVLRFGVGGEKKCLSNLMDGRGMYQDGEGIERFGG